MHLVGNSRLVLMILIVQTVKALYIFIKTWYRIEASCSISQVVRRIVLLVQKQLDYTCSRYMPR